MKTSLLMKSKRWVAGCLAMILSLVVSLPALGLDEAVAADLREQFLYVILAYIGGQTVTDAVTKGRTSGNFPAEDKSDA